MKKLESEWNVTKASVNRKKHGVSFEEAKTAFFDENALVIHDVEHADDEERFILLGQSQETRLLVVCHCYRKKDSSIRIISARKATKKETIQYYGG